MRFLGGEAPGSRALGSGSLHMALMALLAVLISAFMLYATAAWAQTAEEAEVAEAAQSEVASEDDADSSEDEGSSDGEGKSGDEGKSDAEVSEDGKKLALPEKPDEDSEQVMKTPEEAAEDAEQDEIAEKIAEAEDIETLADDEIVGEIARAFDRGGDNDVDTIIIPRGDCTVREGASVTLAESSQYNARGTFTDNRNVQISSNGNLIRILGPNSNPNDNDDIRPINRSNGFDLDDGETYIVVSSRGITCDGGGGGGGGGGDGGNNCINVRDVDGGRVAIVRGNEPVTGTINTGVEDSADDSFVNFRAVYATSTPGGSVRIRLFSDDDLAIDRTIFGARSGVINTEVRLNSTYTYEITPARQGYSVQFQGGPGIGNERCVDPSDLPPPPGVASNVVVNVIERTGSLPDTGEGSPPTTSATGERASTPASVIFSVLSIVSFTGLILLRRLAMK